MPTILNRRFPPPPQGADIPPPYLGLDTEASPNYVASGAAPVVQNFVPGRHGKAPMRGGLYRTLKVPSGTGFATPMSANAIWSSDTKLAIGSGAHVRVWDTTADSAAQSADASTVKLTGSTNAQIGDFVYGYGTAAGVSSNGAFVRWDTTSDTFTAVDATLGPIFGYDIVAYLSRLFALAPVTPGSIAASVRQTMSLYWSDPGGAPTGVLNEWKDDATGLVNQIPIPGMSQSGNYPVGLGVLDRTLLVFTRYTTFALSGLTPATFSLRRVLNIGCTHRTSIVSTADAVYFLSDSGYKRFDGATLTDVSRPIHASLLGTVRQASTLPAFDVQVSAKLISSGSIMLVVTNPAGTTTLGAWVFNIDTQAWSTFTSPLLTSPVSLARTPGNGTWAWDRTRFWQLDGVTHDVTLPEASATTGVDTASEIVGGTVLAAQPIPAQIDSRVIALSTPSSKTQLSRIFVDYRLERHASYPSADCHFVLEFFDGQGVSVSGPYTLPPGTGRQRLHFDAFGELAEVFARTTFVSADNAPVAAAEFYDVWLEYRPAQRR